PSDGDFIRGLVEAGRAAEEDTMIFDGKLVWKAGAAVVDPDRPGSPRVLFQSVPEKKSGKNRVHLDLRVGDERETVAENLVAAGASILHRGEQGPFQWITMADPEANEFCLC
ncbi:MAG: VOC family protein, partial [Rhodococcus sp. (in: high G+C Gram-positive bacteria)]